ncbi:transmembrane gamma-carboxyglutamic acid protein 4 [Pholidichthys leucotaenia]
MFFRLFVFLTLLTSGRQACARTLLFTDQQLPDGQVFVDEGDANSFLSRHLLFNRFDFELFVPGNLERECKEEICDYEEAREVFENDDATRDFWKTYTSGNDNNLGAVDVTALVVGLLCGGIAIIVIVILVWFLCKLKFKDDPSPTSSTRVRRRRTNAALITRRLEEVSLQPVVTPEDPLGLPSYEQAIARSGQHDAPPPPYPGSRPGTLRQ